MVQEKEEAREKARLQRIAKRDEDMLGDCIRLIDYMFQAALVQTVIEAVKHFWNRLDQKNVPKLFVTSVDMSDQGITLDPGKHDFVEMLFMVSDGWFQTLNLLQSMTCVRQYDQFCRVQNHQTVKELLRYQASIQDYITSAIDDTQASANLMYEPFRPIYEFGKTWDEDAFNDQELRRKSYSDRGCT
eukprot:s5819_g4.t1